MSKLGHLRSQLRLLRWGRRFYRWGAAWSSVLTIVLTTLLVLLALDVTFELAIGPRIVLLTLAGVTLLVAFWRLALPWLFVRESDLQMALLVEGRLGYPGRSDLAAALQFESPAAAMWGSPQLEQAVIDRVGRETQHVNVFAGASPAPLVQRVATFLVVAAVAVAVLAIWPDHVAVFFNRMALGEQHYPTRTVLHAIHVNGRPVLEDSRQAAPAPARCAEGQPLWIAVIARGVLPAAGEAEVASAATGHRRTLPLTRLSPQHRKADADPVLRQMVDALLDEHGDEAAVYLAELDRLMEPLQYQLFLGDAWTDPAEIQMVPLPTVELKLSVVAPSYAQSDDPAAAIPPGARQVSVLEGSRIDLQVTCVNKPLSEVALAVTRGGATERFPLEPVDDQKLAWRLVSNEGPLSQITEEFRYEIEVTDEDGLRPAAPLVGVVRIRPDRPPRIAARVVTRVVLPTATPVVNLDLTDDYGVQRPTLELKITRQDGRQETHTLKDLTFQGYNENGRLMSDPVAFPLTGEGLPWRGGCRINLTPLRLRKGDRVSAVFVVSDYRGEAATREAQAASQPLELEVSDEAGVYRAALEADRQALEDITQAADLQQQLLKDD